MSKTATGAVLVATAVVLAFVPWWAPGYKTTLATEMLIFALLAMSIDILEGYAGRTTLCHGALFGVSAYVLLYHVVEASGSLWAGVVLGVTASTVLAAIFAMLAVRTTGVYFLLLTLALGMIVWGVCLRWSTVTGGENGIRGRVRPEMLSDPSSFYYFVLIIFVILAALMWRLVNSPFGRTLQGIRESESRMRTLGYNVHLHLFIGFVVSGFFAGVAGVLYGFFNNFVSPASVGLNQSVTGLLMTLVGGAGTLIGGLIGAIVIISLQVFVSEYTERWSMVLGLMFIVIIIFAPEGAIGKLRQLVAARARQPAPPSILST
jgi:branched-chain amino acid transport system permease protein